MLLVGSSALHPKGTLPWVFASPLIVLGFCVVYGVLFMVFLIFNYEEFLHHHNYTRVRVGGRIAGGLSSCFASFLTPWVGY